jgi:hypothetical protein
VEATAPIWHEVRRRLVGRRDGERALGKVGIERCGGGKTRSRKGDAAMYVELIDDPH